MFVAGLVFVKERYDKYIERLKACNNDINTFIDSDITEGENVLEGTKEFYSVYSDIKDMIQKYSWALDDVFIYLEKAGQAMVDADRMLTEETLRESYK